MQLEGKFTYLGLESFQGKKDPTQTYASIALLQGTDVTKVFLDTDNLALVNALGLKNMDTVKVALKITIGIKTFVGLEHIEIVK